MTVYRNLKGVTSMKVMVNVLKAIYAVATICLFLWMFLSWMDIIVDNVEPNPVHHPMNFFILTMERWGA